GERQLQRLRHRVDVLGRVVAHARKREALEQLERLQQHRALPPEARLEHLVAMSAEGDAESRRRLDAASIAGEVGGGQKPAGALNRGGDPLTDVAAIETVASCVDRRLASEGEMAMLLVGEGAERARKFGLTKNAADRRDGPARPLEVDTR